MVSRSSGFTLVEVVVAMTLLSIATLGIAATGFVAAQAFTRAEIQERVLSEAERILDSLHALPTNGAGTRDLVDAPLSWGAADSTGVVVLRVHLPGRPAFDLAAVR